MFGSGGIRVSGSNNPGLASIQPGTSSSLNGLVILTEEGELELSLNTEDEDTLNDA
jgi:hypothetical protein